MDAVVVTKIWMAGLIGVGVAYGVAYWICGYIGKKRGFLPPNDRD